jgi:hypothetical protein
VERLGPLRRPEDSLTNHHRDVAASLQLDDPILGACVVTHEGKVRFGT